MCCGHFSVENLSFVQNTGVRSVPKKCNKRFCSSCGQVVAFFCKLFATVSRRKEICWWCRHFPVVHKVGIILFLLSFMNSFSKSPLHSHGR